jgi:hypothetical protein
MGIPIEIAPIFERAINVIGFQRAAIALQGVIARFEPVRVINGELEEETFKALAIVGRKIGFDELTRLYDQRLKDRFGNIFDDIQPNLPLDEPEKPKRAHRRRATK